MVLEYCNSGDLFHAIEAGMFEGRLDLQTSVAQDICRGMRVLHERNPPLAHRDLRSPNVLLHKNENGSLVAKVADFGLTVTVSSMLETALQTWQWMSPEALVGQYDERCDLYSFGIVTWEIFVQKKPFVEESVGKKNMVQEVRNGLRPTIPQSCPAHIRALCGLLWSEDPDVRPSFFECEARLSGVWSAEDRLWKVPVTKQQQRRRIQKSPEGFRVENLRCSLISDEDEVVCVFKHARGIWLGVKSGRVIHLDGGTGGGVVRGTINSPCHSMVLLGELLFIWNAQGEAYAHPCGDIVSSNITSTAAPGVSPRKTRTWQHVSESTRKVAAIQMGSRSRSSGRAISKVPEQIHGRAKFLGAEGMPQRTDLLFALDCDGKFSFWTTKEKKIAQLDSTGELERAIVCYCGTTEGVFVSDDCGSVFCIQPQEENRKVTKTPLEHPLVSMVYAADQVWGLDQLQNVCCIDQLSGSVLRSFKVNCAAHSISSFCGLESAVFALVSTEEIEIRNLKGNLLYHWKSDGGGELTRSIVMGKDGIWIGNGKTGLLLLHE
jgi:hypothetical protein